MCKNKVASKTRTYLLPSDDFTRYFQKSWQKTSANDWHLWELLYLIEIRKDISKAVRPHCIYGVSHDSRSKNHHYCNHVLLKIHLSIMQNKQIQRFLHFSNKYACGSPCEKIFNGLISLRLNRIGFTFASFALK